MGAARATKPAGIIAGIRSARWVSMRCSRSARSARGESPVEWCGDTVVAGLEVGQPLGQGVEVGEVDRFDDFALDHREDHLDLVQPTGAYWQVYQRHPWPCLAHPDDRGVPGVPRGAIVSRTSYKASRMASVPRGGVASLAPHEVAERSEMPGLRLSRNPLVDQ